MYKRQLDILLGKWELPNLFSGVSIAISQLLESDLYFQGYCLIKEETLSVKGYLMPQMIDSSHVTVEFKRPGLGRTTRIRY